LSLLPLRNGMKWSCWNRYPHYCSPLSLYWCRCSNLCYVYLVFVSHDAFIVILSDICAVDCEYCWRKDVLLDDGSVSRRMTIFKVLVQSFWTDAYLSWSRPFHRRRYRRERTLRVTFASPSLQIIVVIESVVLLDRIRSVAAFSLFAIIFIRRLFYDIVHRVPKPERNFMPREHMLGVIDRKDYVLKS